MNQEFNPNGVGVKNGNFIGLPYTLEEAKIVFFPVPWDVTVSYRAGTANGPANILDASSQLDLYDSDAPDAWKFGHYFMPPSNIIQEESGRLRAIATELIDYQESGMDILQSEQMDLKLQQVNDGCARTMEWVEEGTTKLLNDNKLVCLIGGDHSTPLGFYKALSKKYPEFGILHLDAHKDLREAYEGFQFSHASIFRNALKIKELTKVVQVGIRDYCEEEVEVVQAEKGRVIVYYDQDLKERQFQGHSWHSICQEIIAHLPQNVHISFDIDALEPSLCPETGTPVPGGFSYPEVIYLLQQLKKSGKKIISCDLVEVGGESDWDGNVGARIAYKMSNLMYLSQL